MSDKKILYDDMIDPAFAEIYHIISVMENKNEVETDLDCEALAHECRKLAYEFVELYDELCKYGAPSYWDMIDSWTRDKAKGKWPPLKRFDVLIDGNVTMTYPATSLAAGNAISHRTGYSFTKRSIKILSYI